MSRSPSPLNFKRQQAGFEPAAGRPRCAICAHVRVFPNPQATEYACDKVGFTSAWAVCRHWAHGALYKTG